uniref:Uncharacterized protein n=1 Tax=Ciona intestinalis TaxID=7719 RepID=H2XXQ6_CIOIN
LLLAEKLLDIFLVTVFCKHFFASCVLSLQIPQIISFQRDYYWQDHIYCQYYNYLTSNVVYCNLNLYC